MTFVRESWRELRPVLLCFHSVPNVLCYFKFRSIPTALTLLFLLASCNVRPESLETFCRVYRSFQGVTERTMRPKYSPKPLEAFIPTCFHKPILESEFELRITFPLGSWNVPFSRFEHGNRMKSTDDCCGVGANEFHGKSSWTNNAVRGRAHVLRLRKSICSEIIELEILNAELFGLASCIFNMFHTCAWWNKK